MTETLHKFTQMIGNILYRAVVHNHALHSKTAFWHHRLNGSSSPVLTATSLSYGKAKNSTPHRIKTLDLIE